MRRAAVPLLTCRIAKPQLFANLVDRTPQEWGDYVRQINDSYTGPRPRIQLNHGNNDETINFNNFREAIKQWTNVLGLEATPTSTDSGFQGTATASAGSPSPVTYDRQFWEDDCGYTVLEAWEALNEKHGMGYEAEAILRGSGSTKCASKIRGMPPVGG